MAFHRFLLFFDLVCIAATLLCAMACGRWGVLAAADLTDEVARFQTWFAESHNASQRGNRRTTKIKVELRRDPAFRFGVYATDHIAAESVYLAVPLGIVIGRDTILSDPAMGQTWANIFQTGGAAAGWTRGRSHVELTQWLLAVFLLHERYIAGPESHFAPYIDLLPARVSAPVFFSDSTFLFLNGTLIIQKTLALRDEYERDYRLLKRHVFDPFPEIFPAQAFTRTAFYWAKGILSTRMIWWDGEPHLVPMLDMINCRQGPTGYERRVHSTVRDGDLAVTRAPWSFQRGEQVFENYGQPDPTYFLYHGFYLDDNVANCAFVEIGNSPSEEFCVAPAKLDDALSAVRKQQRRDDAHSRKDGRSAQERRAIAAVARAILRVVEAMDDTHLRGKRPSTDEEVVADGFRRSQRNVLMRTVDALRSRRDALKPRRRPRDEL